MTESEVIKAEESEISHAPPPPRWAQKVYEFTEYLVKDVGGGPRTIRLDHAINIQKLVTVFFVLGLMYWYDNFTTAAWVYLGLHGVYGYTWLIKDLAFPNPGFEKRMTPGAILMLLGGLNAMYWSLPWLFISRHIEPAGSVLFLAIVIHTLGVAWMVAGDLQKNCTLRYKKGLITNGVFTYTRNPNYLGEILIYGTYALLAAHWFGWLVVALQFCVLFLPRMIVKDSSISRHPGWSEYKHRSGLVIPWRVINGRAIFEKD